MAYAESIHQLEKILISKISEKYSNTERGLRQVMNKFDLDGSGVLNMQEFNNCLQYFLNGVSKQEVLALAAAYDTNGDGSISIKEFVARMTGFQRLLGSPNKKESPKSARFYDQSNRDERKRPDTSESQTSSRPSSAMRGSSQETNGYRLAAREKMTIEDQRERLGMGGIITEIETLPPRPQSAQAEAFNGPTYEERKSRFIVQLRLNLESMARERVKDLKGKERLVRHFSDHLEQISRRLLQESFVDFGARPTSSAGTLGAGSDAKQKDKTSGFKSSSKHHTGDKTKSFEINSGAPSNTLISLRGFIAALKTLRATGQPFLSVDDLQTLWEECHGSTDEFVQELFRKTPKEEIGKFGFPKKVDPIALPNPEVGPSPFGAIKEGEKLPRPTAAQVPVRIRYRHCKTLVSPPTNWTPANGQRSSLLPDAHLELEHVYGYRASLEGSNIFIDPNGAFIVFTIAAAGVVQDVQSNSQLGTQRFFLGHDDDISCLAVDNSGELAITGQMGKPCWASVWFIDDCKEFRKLGHDNNFFEKRVCQVAFSANSDFVVAIGMDDNHSLGVWHLGTGTMMCSKQCGQGNLPMVRSIAWSSLLDYPSQFQVGDEVIVRKGSQDFSGKVTKASASSCSVRTEDREFSNVPVEDLQHKNGTESFITVGISKHIKFWKLNVHSLLRTIRKLPSRSNEDPLAKAGATFGKRVEQPPKTIYAAVYSKFWPGVSFLAADSGWIYIFNGQTAQSSFKAHSAPVFSLAVSDDYLFSGGGDGYIKRWDPKLMRRSRDPQPNADREYDVDMDSEDRPVARGMIESGHGEHQESKELIFNHQVHKKSIVPARPGTAQSVRLRLESEKDPNGDRRKARPKGVLKNGPSAKLRADDAKVPTKPKVRVLDLQIGPNRGMSDRGDLIVYGTHRSEICTIFAEDYEPPRIRSRGHHKQVWGVTAHPQFQGVFATVGDDKLLFVWNAFDRTWIKHRQLDFSARMVSISPDGNHIAVAGLESTMAVYTYKNLEKIVFRQDGPQNEEIDELKYSPDGKTLAVASHDNFIYLYDVLRGYALRGRLAGHTSYVTHIDWSCDSRYLQSNCGGYELLYWDCATGKQVRCTTDNIEADTDWATFTCVLGFPVMGIWPPDSDGTDINTLDRSADKRTIVTGDDSSGVKLFNSPCVVGFAPYRRYQAHSSHVMNVRFLKNDTHVISVGGNDLAIFQWKFNSFPPESTENECAKRISEQLKPPPKGFRKCLI